MSQIIDFANASVTLLLNPVDMRFGYYRLAHIAQNVLNIDLRRGSHFVVFISKKRDICKIIHADEKGTVLIVRKLHAGRFEQFLAKADDPFGKPMSVQDLEQFFNGEPIYEKRMPLM